MSEEGERKDNWMPMLGNAAIKIGINQGLFLPYLEAPESLTVIRRDVEDGIKLHIYATPTFTVNDRIFAGTILEEALN